MCTVLMDPMVMTDPPSLPAGWQVRAQKPDGFMAEGRGPGRRKLRVIVSDAYHGDGGVWRHVSVSSHQAPLPTWTELDWCKRAFIGADRFAYQVHAPTEQHVNLREVLHVWARMDDHDGAVLPDFTDGGDTI